MYRHVKKIAVIVLLTFPLSFFAGCQTKRQTNTTIGAGVGAVAGQVIGRDTGSTLIGAGVGAAAGYLLTGDDKDK